MLARLVLLSVCFFVTAAYSSRAMRADETPLAQPLRQLSLEIARWTGQEDRPFSADILAVLGVDQYLSRTYSTPGEPFVSLYVGYYESQRSGSTMHSPLNCLPGAGWMPMTTERVAVTVVGRSSPITVNRIAVQKGIDRAMVFYWYQSQGRVVASEYASKFYLVYDAVRTNRSDGALVRVVTPVLPGDASDAAATRRGTEFVGAVFPLLRAQFP